MGRVDRDAEIAERLSWLLQCDLDWQYLLDSARRHGLMPSLHQRLSSLGADVPAEAKTQLQDESCALQGSNLF